MGQEFCKGCEDCTNFKNNEGDLSYYGNKPIENVNNPSYINATLDNSVINKTDFQNDTSLLTNHNNFNKNDTLQFPSHNNDLSNNLLSNMKFTQKESDDIFNQHNIENKENIN